MTTTTTTTISTTITPTTLIKTVGILLKDLYGWSHKLQDYVKNNHAYRYMYFVDHSEQGEDCRYAKATLDLWSRSGAKGKDLESLRTLGNDLRRIANDIEKLCESLEEAKKS